MHTSRKFKIHILDMKTGNPVCSEEPLVHDFGENKLYESCHPMISISQNTVAVLFRAGAIEPRGTKKKTLADALVVWNWRARERLYVGFPSPASLRL